EDLRVKIAGSLAEIRMLLARTGIVVMLAGGKQLEEIRDQFMGAREVDWRMDPLFEDIPEGRLLPPGLVRFQLASASLTGEVPEALEDLVGACDDDEETCIERLMLEIERRAYGGADAQ
ncbi:MAG: hypothetical protein U1E22_01625, partial [Coriobacteriia bacterium]|nr:hypothetical protein [Coriobacteriia bacterium]